MRTPFTRLELEQSSAFETALWHWEAHTKNTVQENAVIYINRNKKINVLPMEFIQEFGFRQINLNYVYFEEEAFILGVIKNGTFIDVTVFDNTSITSVLNPKEVLFMQCGYFNHEFLQEHDYRKPFTFFVLDSQYFPQ